MLMIVPMLFIMFIHFKTDNVKELAIAWGVINALFFFFLGGGWILTLLGGASAWIVAWVVFSLANYFEESIFLRLFVLVFGMFAMLKSLSLVSGLIALFMKTLGI